MSPAAYEKIQRGPHADLSPAGHRAWMGDHNSAGWDMRTWLAFNVRMGSDAAFAARAINRARRRHAWADDQVAKQIAGRRADPGFIRDLRRDLLHEAEGLYPRPDPFKDGWELPEKADAIGVLANRMSVRRRDERFRREGLEPPKHDDSKSLQAAREANAARPKGEAEGRGEWWT